MIACSLFRAQSTYPAGFYLQSVAVVDVNNDSKPDIIVADLGYGNAGVLLNTGNGTFNPQVTYPTGSSPYSVAVVDVNSDSKPDIVVANGDGSVGVIFHC
jgi:hypothetical protein